MTSEQAKTLKQGDSVIYKLTGKKFKVTRIYVNRHKSLIVGTTYGEYFPNELDFPKEDKNSVSLYTALKITGILDQKEDTLVYLQYPSKDPGSTKYKENPTDILTLKQVREKCDMQKERVERIGTYWCCHEFEGLLFVMKNPLVLPQI